MDEIATLRNKIIQNPEVKWWEFDLAVCPPRLSLYYTEIRTISVCLEHLHTDTRAGAERGPLFCQCAARCMMWAGRAQGSAVIEGERERKAETCAWKKDRRAEEARKMQCHRNDCGLEPKERKIVRCAVIHYRQVWKTEWCHQNFNPMKPENTFWFVGQKRMGGQSMTDWKIHNKCSSLYVCCWRGLAWVGNDMDWLLNYSLRRLASLQIDPSLSLHTRLWWHHSTSHWHIPDTASLCACVPNWNSSVAYCILYSIIHRVLPTVVLFRLTWNKIKYQWQIMYLCVKNVSYFVIFLSFQSN